MLILFFFWFVLFCDIKRKTDLGLFFRPARIRSRVKAETYTLLDAAAYTSTAELNLSDTARAPDFVALSFYKIFGAPYIGCLLVKKSARKVMESRRYFGGGTVDMVIAVNDSWVKRKGKMHLHERLEDGTLPCRQIFELDHAIDIHRKLYGPSPMKHISMHTTRLIKKLHDDLVSLRHSNGLPVVKIYKDSGSVFGEAHLQGATIAFNIQKDRGGLVKYFDFEKEANAQDIHVRSGSLCNPGGTATYLQWSPTELREAFAYGHSCSSPQAEYSGKALGVVRVSLGAMSSDADIARLVQFVRETYVDRVYDSGGPICLPGDVMADAPISTRSRASAKGSHISEQKEVARMSPRISSDSTCTLTAETAHEQQQQQQQQQQQVVGVVGVVALAGAVAERKGPSFLKAGDLLLTPTADAMAREASLTSSTSNVSKEEEMCSMKSKASRTERLRKSIGEVFRRGSRRQGTHVW